MKTSQITCDVTVQNQMFFMVSLCVLIHGYLHVCLGHLSVVTSLEKKAYAPLKRGFYEEQQESFIRHKTHIMRACMGRGELRFKPK